MPLDGQCPDCGEILGQKRRCSCGWRAPGVPQTSGTDPQIHRCAWTCNGERCWYIGTWANSTRGGGPKFCVGHSRCDNGALGQRIVEESRQDKRSSYEAADIVEETRQAFVTFNLPRDRKPTTPHADQQPVPRSFRRVDQLVTAHMREPGEEG